ncbi:hypothetical protein C7271_23830 [filamentous cyanobacterium CCP5]|nr:hypothetical protein C7271_23830 [filamentous cyanobacterium CCP5]
MRPLLIQQLAPRLLTGEGGGWRLADDVPATLSTSLQLPHLQTQTLGLRWSWSDFLAGQPDPGRHLIEIQVPEPFAAANLYIVNDLPLHPSGLASLTVEVLTGGPSGQLHHEFRLDQPSSARLSFIRETYEELSLRWRAKAIVMTAQGPTQVVTDWQSSSQMIELTTATIGLTPLRFTAVPEIFDHVSAVEMQIGRRRLILTADNPEAWAVGRSQPATVAVSVQLPGGKESLGDLDLGPGGLTVDLADLGVGAMAPVTLHPPANLQDRVAYLAVQVEQGPWRTIAPDTELSWPMRWQNRFSPPSLTYYTRHVPRTESGRTQIITEPATHQGSGRRIEIEI